MVESLLIHEGHLVVWEGDKYPKFQTWSRCHGGQTTYRVRLLYYKVVRITLSRLSLTPYPYPIVNAPLLFSSCWESERGTSWRLQMVHLSTATVGFKGYYTESALVKTRRKWLCDPSLDHTNFAIGVKIHTYVHRLHPVIKVAYRD